MGSFARTAGGLTAAALIGAGVVAATPSTASARQVTNVPCSTAALISAITAANTAGSGELRLASSCNYDLTAAAATGTRGPDGLPIITGNIVIRGGTSTHIRRTVATQFRIFEVDLGARLEVRSLFVEGGDAGLNPGGGLLSSRGTLVLEHVTVRNNTADNGAGIANDSGTLFLQSTLVQTNSVRANGGGGGGVYTDGRFTSEESRYTGNKANTHGGAIYVEQGGVADLFRTTLDHNTAGVHGGGLYNGTGGRSILTRTLVENNTAADSGGIHNAATVGRVTLSGSIVRNNTPLNCAPAGSVPGC